MYCQLFLKDLRSQLCTRYDPATLSLLQHTGQSVLNDPVFAVYSSFSVDALYFHQKAWVVKLMSLGHVSLTDLLAT